jgi:spore coat polysaccharide biosynthesis predicted glycosyltransferase SpsG
MLWCDLAITGSGLTKYEMAVTGTPSLQLSFSEDHAAVNESFVKNGTAKHLGVYDAVSLRSISEEITGLLDNFGKRRFMSEAGKGLLDGLGTGRLIEAIRRKL